MAGERHAIANPYEVRLQQSLAPPLRFVLQTEYRPRGLSEKNAAGVTASATPWFTEFGVELSGIDAVAVLYRLPKDDRTDLLAASIDTSMGPLFHFMSGADFGDPVTTLVALHWPDVYGMLKDSTAVTARKRMLARVLTPGGTQWVVADQLFVDQDVSPDAVLDLMAGALHTFLRVSQFATELPGVIPVLGGPDRTTRRLKAVAGLFTATATLGNGFVGGVQGDEIGDMLKAAREFLSSARALKD
jgi:hypothetical protein